MPNFARRDWSLLYVAICVLLAIIFVVDMLTPLGYAVWFLYAVPTALCLLGVQPNAALLAAAAGTLGTAVDFFLTPASVGVPISVSIFNRLVGVFTVWAVAGVAWMYARSRLQVMRFDWLQVGQMQLAASMRGEQSVAQTGDNLLRALVRYVDAQVGALYAVKERRLVALAGWGLSGPQAARAELALDDGLPGQVAREGQPLMVREVPPGYLQVGSALGAKEPGQLLLVPFTADGHTVGVVELGFLAAGRDLGDTQELLQRSAESVGMAMRSALYRERLQELLQETQQQSEELQVQQEELRVSNEELEERGRALMDSQARLQAQQAELEQSNTRLEEHAQRLERHKQELLSGQIMLRQNAEALEKANQYKSEFLANMSHELRTPLNSSLILSKLLQDNKLGNLTPDQVRYAGTIYSSNTDLLALINDILDLSKVEAGQMSIEFEATPFDSVLQALHQTFEPIAQQKRLTFSIEKDASLGATIHTDSQRLQQILKNLLSNAFKFTEQGTVALRVAPGGTGNPAMVRFEVRDSGIGIPASQQGVIFEAFQQADGTTSRKYGGSGLGLSISRELAQLLGGDITVQSEPGRGSTFALTLPLDASEAGPGAPASAAPVTERPAGGAADAGARAWFTAAPLFDNATSAAPRDAPHPSGETLDDDRLKRSRGKRLILVIEDDVVFARILYELAHELDFDCLLAATAADGLQLAREFQPYGILLDIALPDDSGLAVLERLKRDARTRHVPIHIVSVHDHSETALHLGAIGYTIKPTARADIVEAMRRIETRLEQRLQRILVVEDDSQLRENIQLLLQTDNVEIVGVGSIAQALQSLSDTTFDCVVMDLSLPDGTGFDLLTSMAGGERHSFPPVIVYTGRSLTADEERRLRLYSKSIIIKGAKSPERLLDEVTLFLHSVETELPADQQRMLKQARQRDAAFEGRTILLAEDDVRNIFALSHVLEPLGASLEIARNGREALDMLARRPDIDLVLMDVMMPEMDGLTAMREIRRRAELARLPLIALTAKAMPSDRQRCLDAGANDYISKPIEIDKLLSLCRVWLSV